MKKLVYVTPHLSTGGGPQYLLKKIQLLIDHYDIHVIEYNDLGGFVVQKNKIKELLPNKVHTLGEEKGELISLITNIRPDIVHFEEMPEYFCDDNIATILYNPNRVYTIFETSHDSGFHPHDKRFFPDKYLFCSDNQVEKFKPYSIPATTIEYPIYKFERPNRELGLKKLGLDPDKKHVLHVGLFSWRKNQSEAQAYAKEFLSRDIDDVQFHFVGNLADNFKEYWGGLVGEYLPANCKLWGERNDVEKFYSCMDLFLFTSKAPPHRPYDKETNPLCIKEALSWQIPTMIYRNDTYGTKYDNVEGLTYLSPYDNSYTLNNHFNINLLKIACQLGLEDKLVKCWNDGVKVQLETELYEQGGGHLFQSLQNKFIGLYDLHTDLLVQRSDYGANIFWMKPNASPTALTGISFRIYDVEKDYFSIMDEKKEDLFNKHNLIFEKKFTNFNTRTATNDTKLHSFADDASAWFSYYETNISPIYKKFDIKPGDTVFDIGANYGFFSMYAKDQGAAKIHLFEPNPRTFEKCKKNFERYLNDKMVSYIYFNNAAVTDVDGYDTLHMIGNSSVNSLDEKFAQRMHVTDETLTAQVQTINLGNYIRTHGVDKIDFLKVDCEGAEHQLFQSLDPDILKYLVKTISMEVHSMNDQDSEDYTRENKRRLTELIDKLESCGFEVEVDDGLKLEHFETGNPGFGGMLYAKKV